MNSQFVRVTSHVSYYRSWDFHEPPRNSDGIWWGIFFFNINIIYIIKSFFHHCRYCQKSCSITACSWLWLLWLLNDCLTCHPPVVRNSSHLAIHSTRPCGNKLLWLWAKLRPKDMQRHWDAWEIWRMMKMMSHGILYHFMLDSCWHFMQEDENMTSFFAFLFGLSWKKASLKWRNIQWCSGAPPHFALFSAIYHLDPFEINLISNRFHFCHFLFCFFVWAGIKLGERTLFLQGQSSSSSCVNFALLAVKTLRSETEHRIYFWRADQTQLSEKWLPRSAGWVARLSKWYQVGRDQNRPEPFDVFAHDLSITARSCMVSRISTPESGLMV